MANHTMKPLSATRFEARIYAYCSDILKERQPDADEETIKALGWRETIMQAMDYATQEEQDMLLQMPEKIKNSPDSTDVEGDSLTGGYEGKLVAMHHLDPHLLLRDDITMFSSKQEMVLIDGVYYNLYTSSMTATRLAEVVDYDSEEDKRGSDLLKNICIPKKVTYEGNEYTVDEILERAFALCKTMVSVEIPDSVKQIGDSAFESCEALESVELSYSLTEIQKEVFRDCKSLKDVTIPFGVKKIGEMAFYNCRSLEFMPIPETVESIGSEAFECCYALTNLWLPNSLKTIGSEAFECSPLTSCNLPNSVTELSFDVFYRTKVTVCNDRLFARLEENHTGPYTIPDGITTIVSGALKDRPNLTALVIPDTVTCIETHNSSEALKRIECHALVPPKMELFAFFKVDKSIPVYVPAESVELYRSAYLWNEFTNIQALPIKFEDKKLFTFKSCLIQFGILILVILEAGFYKSEFCRERRAYRAVTKALFEYDKDNAIRSYIDDFPYGRHAEDVYYRSVKLHADDESCITRYMQEFPQGQHHDEVQKIYDECLFHNIAKRGYRMSDVVTYLSSFPDGTYTNEANRICDSIWDSEIMNYYARSKSKKTTAAAMYLDSMFEYMKANRVTALAYTTTSKYQLKDYEDYSQEIRDVMEMEDRYKVLPIAGNVLSLKENFTAENKLLLKDIFKKGLQASFDSIFSPGFIQVVAHSKAKVGDKKILLPVVKFDYLITNQEEEFLGEIFPQLWIYSKNKVPKNYLMGISILYHVKFTIPDSDISYEFTDKGTPESEVGKIRDINDGYRHMTIMSFERFSDKICKSFGWNGIYSE